MSKKLFQVSWRVCSLTCTKFVDFEDTLILNLFWSLFELEYNLSLTYRKVSSIDRSTNIDWFHPFLLQIRHVVAGSAQPHEINENVVMWILSVCLHDKYREGGGIQFGVAGLRRTVDGGTVLVTLPYHALLSCSSLYVALVFILYWRLEKLRKKGLTTTAVIGVWGLGRPIARWRSDMDIM